MNSWAIDLLTLDDLTGDQRALAEIIGMELYINLVCEWGSDSIYIGKCNHVLKRKRNEQILENFKNGDNIKDIARKFKLTQRTINAIVRDERKALEVAPGEGQISLF